MKLFRVLGGLACVTISMGAFHCGSTDLDATFADGTGTGDGGASEGDSSTSQFGSRCDGGACPQVDAAPPGPVCGDGRVGEKEACDDGNLKSGDGCDATCNVESGWACPTAGLRCQAAKCGDGVVAGAEECDYKPGAPVTGCNATTCRIDPGFDCDPKTLACNAVVCGDGKIQRGENCEDGNSLPFDGCFKCQKEPDCAGGVCKASCGDGQRFASEGCDDGNTRDGDGCSSTCQIETGFACTDVLGTPPPSIAQPILVRDFIGYGRVKAGSGAVPHEDFNQLSGSGVLGIVQTTLSATGRPQLNCPGGDCTKNPGHLVTGGAARPNISTDANFKQWYTNVAGVNLASSVTVPLALTAGTYVWDSANPATNGGKNYFDPIGNGGWIAAGKETAAPCGPDRNVSFSSETHFWFEYQGGERFDFAGDDDTWVFVNSKLAIDLGGLHVPKKGFFVLDATNGTAQVTTDLTPTPTAINLGLAKNGTYEVVMFQAERNECGSNFKVTLKDFNRSKSTCVSKCGDGLVASDEVCDDGKNDGSYGGCMAGCMARGPFCGDGKVDSAEQCDDGNTNNSDGCSNTCKVATVK